MMMLFQPDLRDDAGPSRLHGGGSADGRQDAGLPVPSREPARAAADEASAAAQGVRSHLSDHEPEGYHYGPAVRLLRSCFS